MTEPPSPLTMLLFRHTRRRDFIALLGGAVLAKPLAAQQFAMPVIGYLSGGTPDTLAHFAAAFRQGLNEVDFVDGRNVTIDYRWAKDENDRLPELAAELVRRPVDIIFAQAPPSARAAQAATATIPIVFTTGGDPVESGLVASVSRPGGNVTGVTLFTSMLVPKRLELSRELVPHAEVIALLVNPTSANAGPDASEMDAAARSLGLKFRLLRAATESDIDAAFASLIRERANVLLVSGDVFFTGQRTQLVALAARHAIPTVYPFREFVTAGGLMSYGTRVTEGNRQAGIYVGRILKGAKAADLPVVQPTTFELVINKRMAKALGLSIPASLLARADEVLE